MTVMVDRRVTVRNYLVRMPRIPEIAGHPWESVPGYTLQEMQAIEAMLKSEVTHLNEGLNRRSLMIPTHLAKERKSLLNDQLVALRAIRRIMYPTGQPRSGKAPDGVPQKLWKYSNHLARMFHQYMERDDDESWDLVIEAYEKIPPGLLAFDPTMGQGEEDGRE